MFGSREGDRSLGPHPLDFTGNVVVFFLTNLIFWSEARPPCSEAFGRSQSNLSKASLGWGRATLGFGADRPRTLVSMATYSSHRVIIGKTVLPLSLGDFSCELFLYLQQMRTCTRGRRSSKFSQIRQPGVELAALSIRKKIPYAY